MHIYRSSQLPFILILHARDLAPFSSTFLNFRAILPTKIGCKPQAANHPILINDKIHVHLYAQTARLQAESWYV